MSARQLTAEEWGEIDPHIFRNEKLPVLQKIRALTQASLHEALRMFVQRYELLRKKRSQGFEDPPETYWEGFYS